MFSRNAIFAALLVASALVLPVGAHPGNGHGNGGGNAAQGGGIGVGNGLQAGGLPPGQAKKIVPPVAPINPHAAGGMPPVAPAIMKGHGHGLGAGGTSHVLNVQGGNLRSVGQHAVNAFHPTGQTRAGAEHLLNSANKMLKGHGHGHGKFKW